MKGDFSRDTFSPRRHYNTVLMQQGRMQVDADWNEQQAINRHRIETEAHDLIGASGGEVNSAGFEISVHEGDTLNIGAGNLYVDGILCQNEKAVLFESQCDLPGTKAIDILKGDLEVGLVYLDVWEQHLTALDDDRIREVALGGPDTATRMRTVWQVKVLPVDANTSDVPKLQPLLEDHVDAANKAELAQINNRILELLEVDCDSPFDEEIRDANPPSTGQLLAQALPPASAESPCDLPPSAGYERLENQLYRVEIHQPGERDAATFKWSRDNGSVVTAVVSVTPDETVTEIVVRDLGRDETLGFANGQYVELVSDDTERFGLAGPLVQIVGDPDPATRTITVNGRLTAVNPEDARVFHYKLRRWDSAGALEMPSQDGEFVELEGGIQVRFSPGHYNTGDYWLIPARTATRTATGAIEWPKNQAQLPVGIHHHYSRLALVMVATVKGERQLLLLSGCRRLFPHMTELTSLFYLGGDGQEAGSGQPLPQPLVVGVANGDKPVVGAQVRFVVQIGDPSAYDGELEADGNRGTSVVATTNARGEARCSWTLATDLPSQQVKATLVDGTHLPIYFNANLSAAGEAVAKSIQITRVLLANEQDLRIDSLVPVTVLAEGISVECDENSIIDEQTVQGRPTCFITLEMPWPQNEPDMEIWGRALVGFQPLILAANVDAERNVILWRPAEDTGAWLRDTLFQRLREGTERILAHLTLKGNFIWNRPDEDRPLAHLDGEAFAIRRPGGADIELQFPSGDGRRGGDFEMWFWLVPQELFLDSVTLDRAEVTGGTQLVTGTVRIIGTAPSNGQPITLDSSSPGVAPVPANVRIEAGQSSATFQINIRAVGAPTRVTITATLTTPGGSTRRSVDLVVQPPMLSGVTLNPTTVTGRTTPVQGTVTLTGPAPTGGINVELLPNPAIVGVPSSVNVPAGSNTAGFQVNTEPVNSPTAVTITATGQGVQRTATLTVQPPALTQLTLTPATVLGGATSQGTVQINGPAPVNFTVSLDSTDRNRATVPASVTVPTNSTSAQFTVSARPVSSDGEVTIQAMRAGVVQRTASLMVRAPDLTGFTFDTSPIDGGDVSTGRMTLNGPAPSGTSVALSPTNNTAAVFEGSVAVSPNATQITFTATGKTFTAGGSRSVTVTASYLGETRQATLTVRPTKDKEDKDFTKGEGGKEHQDIVNLVGGGPDIASDTPVEPVDETSATAHPFIDSNQRPETGRQALEQPAEEEKPRARRRRGTPR